MTKKVGTQRMQMEQLLLANGSCNKCLQKKGKKTQHLSPLNSDPPRACSYSRRMVAESSAWQQGSSDSTLKSCSSYVY